MTGRRLLALLIAPVVVAAVHDVGTACAQTRTNETVLMSTNERHRAAQERIGYSEAVIAGDTIYLSGIVAGQRPGEASLEPAFDRVFQAVGRILERAGASYADIVEMTSYHTDVAGGIGPQVEAMSAVQRRLLGSPPPAWTAVQVVRLLPEGALAEVKIIARRPSAAAPVPATAQR